MNEHLDAESAFLDFREPLHARAGLGSGSAPRLLGGFMPGFPASFDAGFPAAAEVASRFAFEKTLCILKAAIETEGLWLLHEIDTQKLMLRAEYRIPPLRQLLFFHPRYLVRILEGNPRALIEAPLRVIIHEGPDGEVLLRHPQVSVSFGRYSGLSQLGEELDSICQRVVATVSC